MKNITVISGGTATNHILDAFDSVDSTVSYILPVSDNGGSSSEIIRVLGGCAIGDIRSRLVRLIPDDDDGKKSKNVGGVKELLTYRLSSDRTEAKNEWSTIVDGTHWIWKDVESRLKVLLLSFLIHVDMEIHKRSRLGFNFELASVGNLFLTGARLFFGDLDSGIELICRVCRIHENANVAGCLNTNFTYHIAAILENGEIIRGQSQISHPSSVVNNALDTIGARNNSVEDLVNYKDDKDDTDGLIHPSLGASQIHFEKDDVPPLESKISRVFYISPYGEEIHPKASRRTIDSLKSSDCIVYSIGSLWTSIVPVLLLRGVGEEIVEQKSARKVLLLNSSYDRETYGLQGLDFIKIIVRAVCYSLQKDVGEVRVSDIVTDVVYTSSSELCLSPEEVDSLQTAGVECHCIDGGLLSTDVLREVVLRLS